MAQVPKQKLRKKVIIIKGFSKDENELSGTMAIVDKYKDWFKSNAGGAYEENEIKVFADATAEEIKIYFESHILDFVVVIAIGHGANQVDCQLFGLNDTEIIKLGQIVEFIKSNKQLWLIESCREIRSDFETIDLSHKIPKFKNGGILLRTPITREKSRSLYDKQIKNCDNGNVICYACSKGETAKNVFFTRNILEHSQKWHLSTSDTSKTYNIIDLMNSVKPIINELREEQHSEVIGNIDFPFAISKF